MFNVIIMFWKMCRQNKKCMNKFHKWINLKIITHNPVFCSRIFQWGNRRTGCLLYIITLRNRKRYWLINIATIWFLLGDTRLIFFFSCYICSAFLFSLHSVLPFVLLDILTFAHKLYSCLFFSKLLCCLFFFKFHPRHTPFQ